LPITTGPSGAKCSRIIYQRLNRNKRSGFKKQENKKQEFKRQEKNEKIKSKIYINLKPKEKQT
jgi:hypothetical protein